MRIDATPALGTRPERLRTREVDGLAFAFRLLLTEIEFDLELGRELDIGREGLAEPASKALQRTNLAILDERFDLSRFELAAGENSPQREVAVLTLEFLVVLAD